LKQQQKKQEDNAKVCFFSFAYDDVKNFKVNVVRNSWLVKNKEETFVDGSICEKSKTKGDTFLKNLSANMKRYTSWTKKHERTTSAF